MDLKKIKVYNVDRIKSQTLKISRLVNWFTKLLIIDIYYWFKKNTKKIKKINDNNVPLSTFSINIPTF